MCVLKAIMELQPYCAAPCTPKSGPKSWSYRASAFLKFNNSCNLGVVNRISGRFCLLFSGIVPPVGLQGLEIFPFRATESCIVLGVLVSRNTPCGTSVSEWSRMCYSTEGISLDTEDRSIPSMSLDSFKEPRSNTG